MNLVATQWARPTLYAWIMLCILSLSACGGGGGGGDDDDEASGPQQVEISGSIQVPGGTVTPDNPTGLRGAANRPVSLYRVDDTGNLIGDVLNTATSDADGNYVLLLPTNVTFSSDLIVEAQLDDSTPPETARAIVIDESTDITPITEYIAEKITNATPPLDLSELPLQEVAELVGFVESLPLGPQPDISQMTQEIEDLANLAIDNRVEDLANPPVPPQVRLSGLLSEAVGGLSRPVGGTVIRLYRIDDDGNAIGPFIKETTSNGEGAFTLLLDPGVPLSADLVLEAILGTDTYRALAVNELVNIDAFSTYVYEQIVNTPDVVLTDLDVEEVFNIVAFVSLANCEEAADLATTKANINSCVGAEVSVQVDNAVNDPPIGTTLLVAAAEETATPINISSNVTDADGNVVLSTTTVTGGPANGNLVNNGDGSFVYTGNLNYTGPDSFTYTVEDNDGLASADITVDINVTPVNDPPTGTTLAAIAVEEQAAAIDISGNVSDVDGTVVLSTTTVTGGPTNGNLVNNGDGTFTYTGNPDFFGSDSFTYTVEDNERLVSANITVDIAVSNVNDVPTIGGTAGATAVEGVPYSFTPTANDVDGEALSFSIQNQPAWAVSNFDPASGTFSGTPGPGDVGGDFSNIIISVTAGADTVPLAPFSITVNAAPSGGAVWDQFNWDDGSTWQ